MARIEIDPNYSSPTFARATAATDIFKKEDIQNVAAALSTHVHDGVGKGLAVAFTGVPAGSIPGTALADGGVTSAKIADGTIVAADIADASITNAKLGPDVARDNLLPNGGFEIWQRGAGPFNTSGAYTADRWQLQIGAGSNLSVAKDTVNQDVGSLACMAFSYAHSAGSSVVQPFAFGADGGLVQQLRGKTVSFSVRVRTSTVGAIRATIFGSVLTRIFGSFHTGDGTYQTLTATATVPSSETNLQVELQLSASCTVYLDNAMLVVGSQPATYVPMHPADDVARCLRYYEIIGETATTFAMQGYATAGGLLQSWLSYKARKAVAPTVTKNGTWAVANAAQPTFSGTGVDGVSITLTVTALGMAALGNNTAGNNITAESNP